MSLPVSIPVPRSPGDGSSVSPGSSGPAGPPPPPGAASLLEQGRACLRDAEQSAKPADRYVLAHLAALRAATAVLVSRSWRRTRGRPCRGRSGGVWSQLTEVAPELREWSAHFADRSVRRAAAEAGSPGVTPGEADISLRHAGEFVAVVQRSLSGSVR